MKYPILYKRTSSGKIQQWQMESSYDSESGFAGYRTISGLTDGKKTESKVTWITEGKNLGKSNETDVTEQADLEIKAKYTKQRESGYFDSVADIDNQTYFEPMLAHSYTDRKDKIDFNKYLYSQPKLDGIRCVVSKNGMFTRNGKPILAAPHIFDYLRITLNNFPNLIFDGELYTDKLKTDFNKIVSLVKRDKPNAKELHESASLIEYWVYDLFDQNYPNDTFSTRYSKLSGMVSTRSSPVRLVETNRVGSTSDIDKYYFDYLSKGMEGQIIRLDTSYENKRSRNLLKRKEFFDQEYKILNVCEGAGNRSGTVGWMEFETSDGKPFKSNVKGSFEYLAKLLKNKNSIVGREATVKYCNLTPEGIPRFPYVIAIDRQSYE